MLKNFSSLSVIQIASYIAPLVLLPYLSRVLGVENFGSVFFAISCITICGVLIDFGFELYAPYLISRERTNTTYINQLSGKIFGAKILLFVVVAICVSIFAVANTVFDKQFILLFVFPIFLTSLQPNWLFQSLENTYEIATYFILSRLLYIILVVLFVKHTDDYYKVVICLGICFLVNSGLSLKKMVKLGYIPVVPRLSEVLSVLRESSGYFYARASSAIYSAGGTVFLALAASGAQVGYFASAEQIFRGLQGLFTPVAQALYPYMSRKQDTSAFIRVLALASVVCASLVFMGIVFGEEALRLVFGEEFSPSYYPFLVFLCVLMVNVPSTLLGYPLLGAWGFAGFVNFTVVTAGFIQIFFLIMLYLFGYASALSVTVSILIAEFIVLLMRGLKVLHYVFLSSQNES